MTINLFGREIVLEVNKIEKKKGKNEIRRVKSKFIFRFILAVIVFFIFGTFIEISRIKENYEIGSIAKSDIIAYKNVTYFIDILIR